MKGETLKILQYNVRKERTGVMLPLLESPEVQEMNILAIQEPWHNTRNQSTYNLSHSSFYLIYSGEKETRVCLYINKRLDIDSWETVFSSTDCCSIRLRRRDGQQGEIIDLWVHNIYNPSPASYSSTTGLSTLPVIAEALQKPGEHILLGDFNLHHPRWNNRGRFTYHIAADILLDITTGHQLELALPEESITWRARGRESAIDLVFLSRGIYDTLIACRPEKKL